MRAESEPDEDDFGPAENVTMLALLRFSAHGLDVGADQDTAGLDTVLVAADGQRYPLRPIIERAIAGEEAVELVMEFVDGIILDQQAAAFDSVGDDELHRMIRTMVVSSEEAAQLGSTYAIPVAGGLVAVLGVQFPSSSTLLPDRYTAGRDVDDLFARGLRNAMTEPVELRELERGSRVFVGDSNYIATKMLGMAQLLAEHNIVAPHGLLFGAPNPNLLYVHVLADRASLAAVRNFAMMVAGQAAQSDAALSRDLFIWRNDRIELAGVVDDAVELRMDVTGLLLATVLELAGPNWTHDMFGVAAADDADVEHEPDAPAPLELSEDEFSDRIRTRVVSDDLVTALGLSYATPIAPGLRLVLCLDGEDEVLFVTDDMVATRDIVQLLATGQRNTMDEPMDTTQDIGPGITGLYGESMFTASKALGMAELIGTVLPLAPYGVLFGVPHRHVLYVHVITGSESIEAVARLAAHVDKTAKDGPIPGGPVSAWTYYWHEGSVDVVAGVNERGVQVDGSGRFGALMESFTAV